MSDSVAPSKTPLVFLDDDEEHYCDDNEDMDEQVDSEDCEVVDEDDCEDGQVEQECDDMEETHNDEGSIEEEVGDGPLRTAWVLYAELAKPADQRTSGGYAKSKSRVMRIESIKDFWSAFNNVAPPSLLVMNSMYQLFREGVQPEWEDPTNANGHSFEFGVDVKLGDKLWIEFAIGAIGENLPFADEVVGVFIKLREKGPRVGFWLSTRSTDRTHQILRELADTVPQANLRPLMVYDHAQELRKLKSGGGCGTSSASHTSAAPHTRAGRGNGGSSSSANYRHAAASSFVSDVGSAAKPLADHFVEVGKRGRGRGRGRN